MSECITCNRLINKVCDRGLSTEDVQKRGIVSVSPHGGEIDCNQIVPYVDFGSPTATDYKDAMKHRRELRRRHNLGFKKNVTVCPLCGFCVCRCHSRRSTT